MKNTNDDTNDEEKMIAETLMHARMGVEVAEKGVRAAKFELDIRKAALENINQAALDYMQGNGLVECDHFSLRRNSKVAVPDVDALPEEYKRTKVVVEADKNLIKKNRPQSNWYTIEETFSINLKAVT